jgi:phosphotransferase system  glucose/maltose/N-acetylglucosamine-specific IIC component
MLDLQEIKYAQQANEDSQRAMAVIVWIAWAAMVAFFGVCIAWGYMEQFKEAL